eukprot:jgi/Botrbrau1/18404/Bobra.0869s0002.1
MALRTLTRQLLSRAMSVGTIPTLSHFPSGVRQLCPGVRAICDRARTGHVYYGPQRFHVQGLSTVAAQALKDVVEREINYEKSDYQSLVSSDIIRKSWKVEEDTGGALLKLSKENNSAKVIITVDVNTQVQDDYEQDDEAAEKEDGDELGFQSLTYTASVIRGDYALMFEVRANYDGLLEILHVDHQKADESLVPADAYEGPSFDDLDMDLQEQFVRYLEDLGLSPEFNQELLELAQDKEQREYMGWLDRVSRFLS